ncbi:type II secretion system GspH family protein [Patescibacteria group bacterium]|nr:type II secretion system GspH family protein [Patescibacteria group bacterium]MBU1922248.1 type II secretion system GspH family protein [Patescibacteria group bacterium]
MMLDINKKNSGFTLIEILISITIFAIIMVLVIANLRSGQFSSQLNLAATNLVSELRQKQNMTLAGQFTKICDDGAGNCEDNSDLCPEHCVSQFPLGGYGLVFDPDAEKLIFFANNNEEAPYEETEKVREVPISPTGQVKIKEINTLTEGVSHLEIIFAPPRGEASFSGDILADRDIITITLEHINSGEQKSITINKISGRIDAND